MAMAFTYFWMDLNLMVSLKNKARTTCKNIFNLIFNSIQGMYGTNKNLEIEIYQSNKLPDDFSSYKSSLSPESIDTLNTKKDMVYVHIKDTGIGIADELQDKIFSPFFTTKKLGEGIGLGLFVCKKIIEDHGGFILFKSSNINTEFVVVLPLL